MKCQITGQNLRAFSKAIRLFSKLSEEVLLIADPNGMKLQSINENKTAFVEIQFKDRFFHSFECNVETKCKLFLKSLILVFRVLNIDRIVTICTLLMSESMAKVVFEMKCKNGVSREYFLPYMESTSFRYNSNLNQTNPTFKVQSKLMSECLQHFSSDTKDISLWLLSDQILFKSYFDDIDQQYIITSFAYKSREFRNYTFSHEISVTFNLKDLKIFTEFASFHDQNIDCYFQSSGKPIEFIVNTNEFYSGKIILSTHDFPEDECPVPPTINQHTHQSSSLIGSGDLSIEYLSASQPNANNSVNTSQTPLAPECLLNTSVSNANTNEANDGNEDDPFGGEDDDAIIEEMLTQLPDLSRDDASATHTNTAANTEFTLTGSALHRYHMSVLFGSDDEDNPVLSSQDIIAPESDEDQ